MTVAAFKIKVLEVKKFCWLCNILIFSSELGFKFFRLVFLLQKRIDEPSLCGVCPVKSSVKKLLVSFCFLTDLRDHFEGHRDFETSSRSLVFARCNKVFESLATTETSLLGLHKIYVHVID